MAVAGFSVFGLADPPPLLPAAGDSPCISVLHAFASSPLIGTFSLGICDASCFFLQVLQRIRVRPFSPSMFLPGVYALLQLWVSYCCFIFPGDIAVV